MRLVNGNVDLSTQARRSKAMIMGLKKREGVTRKKPFDADLLRRMRMELSDKSALRGNGAWSIYFELFTARIVGLSFLLRISEIEALKWGDISLDTQDGENYLPIRIRQSKRTYLKTECCFL